MSRRTIWMRGHIEWLKRYLNDYENAFILISHDIPFLNSVVNLIYHMENRSLDRYPGDYDHFQEVYAMKKVAAGGRLQPPAAGNQRAEGFCSAQQSARGDAKHGDGKAEKAG